VNVFSFCLAIIIPNFPNVNSKNEKIFNYLQFFSFLMYVFMNIMNNYTFISFLMYIIQKNKNGLPRLAWHRQA